MYHSLPTLAFPNINTTVSTSGSVCQGVCQSLQMHGRPKSHRCASGAGAGGGETLHIFAGTWNVGASLPPPALTSWLHAGPPDVQPDVYVIALQETQTLVGVDAVRTDTSKAAIWANAIRKCIGEAYSPVATRQLTGLMIIVLSRHPVQDVRAAYAATGFLNQGNKGAVAARFEIAGRTIACVSAHLTANHDNCEKRNADYFDILRKAFFAPPGNGDEDLSTLPGASPDGSLDFAGARKDISAIYSAERRSASTGKSARLQSLVNAAATFVSDVKDGKDSLAMQHPDATGILDHDLVLWMGDLNYRVDMPGYDVERCVQTENWDKLAYHDQLITGQRLSKPAFKDFEEAKIQFPPTYKYHRHMDVYVKDDDGMLKRVPSYTDRILWRVSKEKYGANSSTAVLNVSNLCYDAAPLKGSDHRPVYAMFCVHVPHAPPAVVPKVRLSTIKLEFEEAPKGLLLVKKVDATNDGIRPAILYIPPKTSLPRWLTVRRAGVGQFRDVGHGLELLPGRTTTLVFEVCAQDWPKDPDEILEHCVTLGAGGLTVHVHAPRRASCFGVSLRELILHPEPMAEVERLVYSSSGESDSDDSDSGGDGGMFDAGFAPQHIPKEIWELVNALRMNGCPPCAFTIRAHKEEWHKVLRQIDYGENLLELQASAIGTCLLQILVATKDGIIPHLLRAKCLSAGRERDAIGVHEVVRLLPDVQFNVFVYIIAFIADTMEEWTEMDVRQTAEALARALFGAVGDAANEFVLMAITEMRQGRLMPCAMFDVRVSAKISSKARLYEHEKKSSKWKLKARRKIHKLLS